jgi:hypothetical protein
MPEPRPAENFDPIPSVWRNLQGKETNHMRLALVFFSLLLILAMAGNAQPGIPAGSGTVAGWTTFQDSAEHAFQVDVPRVWKTTGGLYRFGQLDPRFMVDTVSPDGSIDIRLGDYRIPPFAPLTPILQQLGFREGRAYNPRGLAQEVIANYRPGWVFADLYGQARFSSACTHLNLKSMKKMDPIHPSGPNVTTTAGEVIYTCESSKGTQIAYVFAETQLTSMQSSGAWLVSWLYSFVAPQNQAAETLKTMLHSLSTFAVDPEWYYQQLMKNGQASTAVMADFKKNMATIQQDYERRSAASQSQFDQMDRAIRGVDLTTDPVDGKQREVFSTGKTHWINGLEQVVDSPTAPGGNVRKLNTLP